jgi:hypothetical protein
MALEVELVDPKVWPQGGGELVELVARTKRAVQEDEVFHHSEVAHASRCAASGASVAQQ